jgi:hypothetical protein
VLYPLSYRREGPVGNVVEDRARVAPGAPNALVKVPCVARQSREGRSGAGLAYRPAARACGSGLARRAAGKRCRTG